MKRDFLDEKRLSNDIGRSTRSESIITGTQFREILGAKMKVLYKSKLQFNARMGPWTASIPIHRPWDEVWISR